MFVLGHRPEALRAHLLFLGASSQIAKALSLIRIAAGGGEEQPLVIGFAVGRLQFFPTAVYAVPGHLAHHQGFDFRPAFAYRFGMSKPGFTVVIGACVIAAIRLAREDKLLNTPKSVATIGDSVALARKIVILLR
jgi:hypothetical protein